jgi:hypothetical protein
MRHLFASLLGYVWRDNDRVPVFLIPIMEEPIKPRWLKMAFYKWPDM